MTIQPLGRGDLALALTPADLSGRPADLELPQLLALLRELGVTLPPRTRVEAYIRPDSLFLLVRPPRRPRHYNSVT